MKYLIILITVFSFTADAQYYGKNFSIGLNYIYTTDARIYLNPNSPIFVERNNAFEISDISNPGIDFRYKLLDEIFLELNLEYMESSATGKNEKVITSRGTEFITVEDGFKMIPMEFSIYYLLPFSTEKFKFLMGGGTGYYYGSMIRKFGNAEVSNAGRKAAFGIQVAIGMEYLLNEYISFRTEMKFRDPELTVKNRYNQQEYIYKGEKVKVTSQEFESKINVNGLAFVLGVAFHF
jgi:outer membrane protein W